MEKSLKFDVAVKSEVKETIKQITLAEWNAILAMRRLRNNNRLIAVVDLTNTRVCEVMGLNRHPVDIASTF